MAKHRDPEHIYKEYGLTRGKKQHNPAHRRAITESKSRLADDSIKFPGPVNIPLSPSLRKRGFKLSIIDAGPGEVRAERKRATSPRRKAPSPRRRAPSPSTSPFGRGGTTFRFGPARRLPSPPGTTLTEIESRRRRRRRKQRRARR